MLARAIGDAISTLVNRRSEFDVVFVYLPGSLARGFCDRETGFDLHDHIKAVTASRGVPSQVLNDDAFTYRCRCSVMWRLGIALYAKAGGVPWKLAESQAGTAYIGLSYALRNDNAGNGQFVTCCSQIFDADGAGLEFVVYDARGFEIRGRNPYLTRGEARRLMSRTLSMYQRQHGGRLPSRVVVHKTTDFRRDEVDGAFDALRAVEAVELVQVKQDVSWRGIRIDPPRSAGRKGNPAAYPVERGTLLGTGSRTALLWTQGNVRSITPSGNYYKEGKGTPTPLELTRFSGHGDWVNSGTDVLRLTKMNWNNDGLYDRLPATISYSQLLARVVERMPSLSSRPYPVRLFI